MIAMPCRSKSVIKLSSAVAVLANIETVLLSFILLQCLKKPNKTKKLKTKPKQNPF